MRERKKRAFKTNQTHINTDVKTTERSIRCKNKNFKRATQEQSAKRHETSFSLTVTLSGSS